MNSFTRSEWLETCRTRAAYMLAAGKCTPLSVAYTTLSNLRSHNETRNHEAVAIAVKLMEQGKLRSAESVRVFVERFVK